MLTPDGKRIRATVLGLAWKSAKTGQTILIAAAKDTVGVIQPPNRVLYKDAFDAIQADVQYTYRTGSLEADVILREKPVLPEGFDAATARLQVVTDFAEVPEPKLDSFLLKEEKDPSARAALAEPDLTDTMIDFGAMQMMAGEAFSLPKANPVANKPAPTAPVAKVWEQEADRTTLTETVEYSALRVQLEQLPQQRQKAEAMKLKPFDLRLARDTATARRPMQVARAQHAETGVVIDWV